MTYTRILLGAILAGALSTTAMAAVHNVTLRDRQQAACANDAQTLCASVMPDIEKVTACMKTKRAQVSPECAAMYDVKK